MAVSLKHQFVNPKSDGADTTITRPTDWNAEHDLTLATDKLLGRTSSGSGAVEEVTCSDFAQSLLDDTTAQATRVTLGFDNLEILQADRTYYVRTDGNNSNTGLTNDAAGAFRYPNNAIDAIRASLDFNGYTVTLQLQSTTWSLNTGSGITLDAQYNPGAAFLIKSWVGGGILKILGDHTTPSNCLISVINHGGCVNVGGGQVVLDGVKLFSSGSSHEAINALTGSIYVRKVDIASGFYWQIFAGGRGGNIYVDDDYAVSGGAVAHHMTIDSGGLIQMSSGITCTISNSPSFISWLNIGGANSRFWAWGIPTFVNKATVNASCYQYFVGGAGSSINIYQQYTQNVFPGGKPGVNQAYGFAAGTYDHVAMEGDETTTSTTLANSSQLTFNCFGGYKYNFKFRVWYDTPAAADFKFSLHGDHTNVIFAQIKVATIAPGATAYSNVALYTALDFGPVVVTETSGTNGYLEIDGILTNGTGSGFGGGNDQGIIYFQYAQNAASGTTTIRQGSYVEAHVITNNF